MSRNFVVLNKNPQESSVQMTGARSMQGVNASPSEYAELVQRLFVVPSVVAVIGTGKGEGATTACAGVVSELSRCGMRTLLVDIQQLIQSNSSEEPTLSPADGRNVWRWPARAEQRIEFFKSESRLPDRNWLDGLRCNYDAVVLNCQTLETAPGGAAIAAMADSAVLVVEAARTPKNHILRDQRALRLSGVRLAGCILINGR